VQSLSLNRRRRIGRWWRLGRGEPGVKTLPSAGAA
jgi:hypothetical protein